MARRGPRTRPARPATTPARATPTPRRLSRRALYGVAVVVVAAGVTTVTLAATSPAKMGPSPAQKAFKAIIHQLEHERPSFIGYTFDKNGYSSSITYHGPNDFTDDVQGTDGLEETILDVNGSVYVKGNGKFASDLGSNAAQANADVTKYANRWLADGHATVAAASTLTPAAATAWFDGAWIDLHEGVPAKECIYKTPAAFAALACQMGHGGVRLTPIITGDVTWWFTPGAMTTLEAVQIQGPQHLEWMYFGDGIQTAPVAPAHALAWNGTLFAPVVGPFVKSGSSLSVEDALALIQDKVTVLGGLHGGIG